METDKFELSLMFLSYIMDQNVKVIIDITVNYLFCIMCWHFGIWQDTNYYFSKWWWVAIQFDTKSWSYLIFWPLYQDSIYLQMHITWVNISYLTYYMYIVQSNFWKLLNLDFFCFYMGSLKGAVFQIYQELKLETTYIYHLSCP